MSILIFYKLSVSWFWVKQNSVFSKKSNIFGSIFARSYINVIFFQYWINFFSSIIIIFSLINIVNIYGSSDWVFINLINQLNNDNLSFNDFEYGYISLIPLFFALFLKIGLTPTHLFKIEIYKGIPFISIFYYTTYYFFIYFFFVIFFIFNWCYSYVNLIWVFLLLFLTIGLFNILSILFDVTFIKAFFAYSTVINTVSFFILIVASI